MTTIAEVRFDIASTAQKVVARLHQPKAGSTKDDWICRFEIGGPIAQAMDVHGSTSVEALALGLKGLCSALYGSDLYREGKLGLFEDFGGYLGIPAPRRFQIESPFPF